MSTLVFAGIPYETFPDFSVGFLTIRTFGTMVAVGVLLGAWIAARQVEQWGVPRDETYRLATRMVVAGLIGSRVTWVFSHLDQIDSPIDVIAVWEGGIQFSGGFIAAILFGFPTFRTWSPKLRWRILDGYAYGLTIGLAIGRIGCYSVGEHFGRSTEFFLGTTYRGGSTQEDFIGDVPLVEGMTFHNTALYEFLHLVVLFGLLSLVLAMARRAGRVLPPGTLIGIFCVWYGIGRFATDVVRTNDERVLGMTGAQFMGLALIPVGLWILLKVRHDAAAAPEYPAEIAAMQAAVQARAGVEPASSDTASSDTASSDTASSDTGSDD
ncbi:prolipoprotein diacylglyceryl transferase [Actinospongicola halichondriae]|uniref:prolipoprotein diacylglyceryl transferase n=1 Tax=Actinospongicola halichondriae TaxID=3236844 RepID=UPI003D376C7C